MIIDNKKKYDTADGEKKIENKKNAKQISKVQKIIETNIKRKKDKKGIRKQTGKEISNNNHNGYMEYKKYKR